MNLGSVVTRKTNDDKPIVRAQFLHSVRVVSWHTVRPRPSLLETGIPSSSNGGPRSMDCCVVVPRNDRMS